MKSPLPLTPALKVKWSAPEQALIKEKKTTHSPVTLRVDN